jgi:Haem-binding uptake, Tiki superfamily, ChaN
MATTSTLRLRRNAAQLHALAEVERTIRATDPNSRRKYLRDFTEAFQSYHSVLTGAQVWQQLAASDIVLIGDYHALASSQLFCEKVLTQLASEGRPVVLGLEMIFSRDQHLVDEWASREIDGTELRDRLRFDHEWGYDWFPMYRLLETARANCVRIYGLDCCPRNDLRKIARRDHHAAERLRRIRKEHPGAAIVVLFGESHLAPTHLPQEIRTVLPDAKVTTVLQNVDALYWKAGGEKHDRVEAVRASEDVLCVFNATPLEKYESYRMYLERWAREPRASLDMAPTVLNLADALLQFLNVDKYTATAGTNGLTLVDVFPEVCYRPNEDGIVKFLLRKRAGQELRSVLRRMQEQGCTYSPRLNAFFIRHFQMLPLTEEIAHFVHRACRGAIGKLPVSFGERAPEDIFYGRVLEHALRTFGSRVLYPARPVLHEADIYALYLAPEQQTDFAPQEFEKLLDFVVMHKDYEAHRSKYLRTPVLLEQGISSVGKAFEFLTKRLGELFGHELYEAYLAGQISKRTLRSAYFCDLAVPGAAETTYFALARRCALRPRKFVS